MPERFSESDGDHLQGEHQACFKLLHLD